MIVNDDAAKKRLQSPMNLINSLASNKNSRSSAMSLFGIGKTKEVVTTEQVKPIEILELVKTEQEKTKSFNPFEKPSSPVPAEIAIPEKLEDILENADAQIKLGLAHDAALKLLGNSIAIMTDKLDDVSASKLPTVIVAASTVVESIRRERSA